MCFFEPPRKCGCSIDKAMLDGMCVNCLERGLKCSSMGSEVSSAQALPGFARLNNESRAYKCLAAARSHATDATWLICHVRIVLFLFEGRGVWNIRTLPPWDCRVWERLRWMWMWMLWQLRMVMASTAQPAQSVLQATRRVMCSSCAPDFFSSGESCVKCPQSLWSQCNPDLHCTCPCTGPCAWCSRLAMGAEASSNPTTSKPFKCIDGTSEGSSAALVATLWLGDDFHFFGRQRDPVWCVFSTCTFFAFFSKSKSSPFISKSTGEGQLWAVLAVLAGKTDGKSSERSPFWELPYVQTIQFSVSSLKGAFNLQCRFEAWAEFLEQRRTFYNILQHV